MYVRTTPKPRTVPLQRVPDLMNSLSIHRLLGKASIADARHPRTSCSPHSQRSTRMSRPCSRSTTLIAAPSPATVTRATGLRPTQHNRSKSRPCHPGEAVVRFHSFLDFWSDSISTYTNGPAAELPCRFVSKLSKLRRFLSGEDLRNRRRSEPTT